MNNLKNPDQKTSQNIDRRGRPGRLPAGENARITRRITALSIIVGVVLVVLKTLVFADTGSVGILSSLVHSALDLIAGLSSFIAVRYGAKPPNARYRYGRGKAEGFSAIFQICLIVLASVHLLETAISKVENPHMISGGGYAIAVMVFAIVVTFWLLIAQSWAVRATGSLAVRGDRAHYLADMLANIAVITGLALTSYTPFVRADALVGVGIALWLLLTAFKLTKLAWSQLMDMELPDDEREMIRDLALQDQRINGVHDLRTRAAGPNIHIQMQLDLPDKLTLSEAHDIVLGTEKRIIEHYPSADILIHPHPSTCHDLHGNARFRQGNEHKH
ncbi:MAG TPA: cation diffusion facilitator family transporter [Hellea balneolensis]|uniref:Cation diffusion facilitator family transporter n=1 Tax=Hellea balneolensis TaxID=287478 RepID=A0A7C5R3B1_9PROT|nr:cation diffusion facilitator family transporter [Hellea balneolensis]